MVKKYLAKKGLGKALEAFKKMSKVDKERASKLDPKAKKKFEEAKSIIDKSIKKPYKKTTKSEMGAEVEAINKSKKILYPKGEQSEVYSKAKIGDTRPQSFKTYKGKKLVGKTWEDRAKNRQRMVDKEK